MLENSVSWGTHNDARFEPRLDLLLVFLSIPFVYLQVIFPEVLAVVEVRRNGVVVVLKLYVIVVGVGIDVWRGAHLLSTFGALAWRALGTQQGQK
jgi:hypothetical protein